MKVRYTKRALAQIDEILTYIDARSPQGATHVRDRIVALIALLEDHPYAGRQTTRAYVRLIDYRVTSTEIVIMRFRHAARRPPRTR